MPRQTLRHPVQFLVRDFHYFFQISYNYFSLSFKCLTTVSDIIQLGQMHNAVFPFSFPQFQYTFPLSCFSGRSPYLLFPSHRTAIFSPHPIQASLTFLCHFFSPISLCRISSPCKLKNIDGQYPYSLCMGKIHFLRVFISTLLKVHPLKSYSPTRAIYR